MVSIRANLAREYPYSCLLQKQPRVHVKYLVRVREPIERGCRCRGVCYVSKLDLVH